MPATSKQQQKFFGLALSVKRGDTPRSEVSDDVLKVVDTMSEKEIEKYAGTEHTGLPTKKEEVEDIIRQEVRNWVRPLLGEGRAFINAARKAKEEGKTEFEFNGKTYPVTLKEEVLNEMNDLEYVGDQLVNGVGEGFMSRSEFVNLVGKETKYDKNTLGKIYDAYLKLDGRNRVKLDMTRNMKKFLNKMGLKESVNEAKEVEVASRAGRIANDVFNDSYRKVGKQTSTLTFKFNKSEDYQNFVDDLKGAGVSPKDILESVVNEGTLQEAPTRRSNDFFNNSKHGKAIYKLLRGKPFNASVVRNYLDTKRDELGYPKGIRVWDFIGKDLGLNIRKYDNQPVYKYQRTLVQAIDDLYHTHIKESVNENYKSIMSDGGRNLFFAIVDDKTDRVETIDLKKWLKASPKDKSSDDSKKRVVNAILRNQKQFNKKVDYNMWEKKNKPSFEEKMDYFMKNGFINNITKRGIKVYEGVESVNEAKVELEFDLFKNYNQRRPDKTMLVKVDDSVKLSKYLATPEFNRIKKQYDYVEVHYGDKFLGSMMAGTDNWKFKKGSGLSGSGFKESVNEGRISKTFKFPKSITTSKFDEIDSDLSRMGIKSEPDFNTNTIKVSGDERKIMKIVNKYKGIEESVDEVTRLKMSPSQMKQLHKAYDKLSYDQMKRIMLSVVKRDKFLKSIKKFDKSSLQQLVDMKPNSPFSKAVQAYVDGKIQESVVNETKVSDFIATSIPSSKIPQTYLPKAEVGMGLSMHDKLGKGYVLTIRDYTLDYRKGKVALVLSRIGKQKVKARMSKDSTYLQKLQKFANDYLRKYVKDIKESVSETEKLGNAYNKIKSDHNSSLQELDDTNQKSSLVSEMKYTNQTGIKSSLLRDNEFSNLLSPKEQKWARGNDVKIYKDRFGFTFTDGKKEMVFDLKKPISVVKPMGNARSEIKKVYQQNESVVSEKKVPKKSNPADYHQHKIAVDTVKNPNKSLMGGPSAKEAEEILMKKFGYSKSEISKLQK